MVIDMMVDTIFLRGRLGRNKATSSHLGANYVANNLVLTKLQVLSTWIGLGCGASK